MIKISAKEYPQLEKNSLFSHNALVSVKNNTLLIKLPIRLSNYYDLDQDNYNYEIDNDVITVTIIAKPTISEHKSSAIRTILILEDNPYWAGEFYNKFSTYGYIVFVAKNMDEARRISEEEKIDYYILDDEIKYIKDAENFFIELKRKHRNIYATFITSYPITENKMQRLTKLGFSSIVLKQRTGDKSKDAEEITNEQLVRLEMIHN